MNRIKVMATTFVIAVVGSFMITSSVFATTNKQEPSIKIENDSFDCKIVEGKTYIPMRKVFEKLGFEVIWNADTKTVQLKKDGLEALSLNVENSEVSGVANKVLENKVLVIDSQTMLPIREILEILGYNVEWLAQSKEIIVSNGAEVEVSETTTETTTEFKQVDKKKIEAKEEKKVTIIEGEATEVELVTKKVTEPKEDKKVVIINGEEYEEGDEEAIRQAVLRSILETKNK